MIPRKFQVFVSSTYADLKEERSRTYESILAMGHIPVGMEYFSSRSSTSVSVIKGFLDQCDLQITIVGTRYGSLLPKAQISYTEMEYDYANEIGIPQLGFLQRSNGGFVSGEDSPKTALRLKQFREKITARQCAFWENPAELANHVQRALSAEIAECTRPGWIRGDRLGLLISDELKRLSSELSGVKLAIDRYRKNVVENNRQRFERGLLPRPQISGFWQCQEKSTTAEIFEYAGAIVSHCLTGTHEHWLHGVWSPENTEVQTQVWRRERVAQAGPEKRLTIMFGRIFNITASSFSSEVFASDGNADLEHNFSEHLTWKRVA